MSGPTTRVGALMAWVAPILVALGGLLCAAEGGDVKAPDNAPSRWMDGHIEEFLGLYRHLHANPELSFQEVNTSRRMAEELRKAGVEVASGIGQHGVVAILKNGPGPLILVRGDMDALPIVEKTGLPYASKVSIRDESGDSVGVMHACGHDMHMTCLVATARWLADHKDRWSGTVMVVAQPAEEKIGGAEAMLKDGLYERFGKPTAALALHVAHDLETGKVGFCPGPAMASSTSVDLIVRGKGGHGAMPHNTVDPIVLSAALILDLQTIVSREVKPVDPAVVTIGSIHGGTKHNIIPSEVKLQLTLRAFREEVRDQLIEGVRRRAKALAVAHRAPEPQMSVVDSTPPTVNTRELVTRVLPFLRGELGESNVVEVEPTMGAEDFGLFGRGGVPTFMFRLGTIPPERMAKAEREPVPSLHSPFYHPDPEPSLRVGVRAMTSAVVGIMPRTP